MPDTATQPLIRPVLDVIVAAARPHRGRHAYTEQEIAGQLPAVSADDLKKTLVHLVCGSLVFMREVHNRNELPRYDWAYVPTAAAKRLLQATAGQGGPTEEQLEEAIRASRNGSGRGKGPS